MPSTNQLQILLQVAQAIVDTVAESPEGVPASTFYLAFVGLGVDLPGFERLMQALVDAGKLRRVNHCYFLAPGATRNAKK